MHQQLLRIETEVAELHRLLRTPAVVATTPHETIDRLAAGLTRMAADAKAALAGAAMIRILAETVSGYVTEGAPHTATPDGVGPLGGEALRLADLRSRAAGVFDGVAAAVIAELVEEVVALVDRVEYVEAQSHHLADGMEQVRATTGGTA